MELGDNKERVPPKTNPLAPVGKLGGGGRNKKKKNNNKKNVVISENKVEVVSDSWRTTLPPPPPPPADSVPDQDPVPSKPDPITVSVSDTKRKRGSKGKSLLPLASRRDHSSRADQAEQIIQISRDVFSRDVTVDSTLTVADVGLYTSRDKMFELVALERANHTSENHHHQATLLGIWSSDITGAVDQAIQTRTVSESLLSVAVMCGMDKYRDAVRCYINQLRGSRDFLAAASYMLLLGETRQAINMLVQEGCFREAVTIAKMRLSPSDELIRSIYEQWARKQEAEMQFDSAIKCYLACGDANRAIMVMLRRKDVASLETTLQVAEITGEEGMVGAIREALDEAREREKVEEVREGVEKLDCEEEKGKEQNGHHLLYKMAVSMR